MSGIWPSLRCACRRLASVLDSGVPLPVWVFFCRQDFDGAPQGVACVSLTCSSHDRYVRIAFN